MTRDSIAASANREKQQQVINLCDAVLDGEIETARLLAATIILAIDSAKKKGRAAV